MKRKIFNLVSQFLRTVLFLRKPNKFSSAFYEDIELIHQQEYGGDEYKVYCPNAVNYWRAETYFTKEPDMIRWIDTFDESVSFMDIGANIGLYSMYAARKGANRITAFEPESQNYALLNKNIYLNSLSEKISALNLGLSDSDNMESLFIPIFQGGMALNNLGESVDWQKKSFKADFRQTVLSFSLDSFIERYPELRPTHIKIDVDGLEHKIILGAKDTLKHPEVKELMIELNEELPEDLEIIEILTNCGFKMKSKESCPIATDEYKNVFNYLFAKDS